MYQSFIDRSQQSATNSNVQQKKLDPLAQLKWFDNASKAPGWNTNDIQPAQLTAEENNKLLAQRQKEFSKHTFNVPMQMFAREEELQEKKKQKEESLQMKQDEGIGKKTDSTASSNTSSGLPDSLKTKMENSFNTDFSSVRVHTNSEKATQIGAVAYTQGNDIYFAPGQYNPNSQKGQELLGHELTHVVQQRQGRVHPTIESGGMPINDSATLEKEADTIGGKAAQGKLANVKGKGRGIQMKKGDPPYDMNVQIRGTFTFGGKKGTSHFNLGFSYGVSIKNDFGQLSLNIAGNLANGGLGSPFGKNKNMMGNLVLSPALTVGGGENQTAAPLNTFQSGALTSVNNNFAYSGTIAQNFVFSTENKFQRVGAYALKAGDVSLSVYNDTKKFMGDGGDRWWSGGGSLTITNFMGDKNNMLRFGNDVFTGNSIPDMEKSASIDALMPTYDYGKGKSLHYAGQNAHDQSLNMGQTFIMLDLAGNLLQLSHSGKFDMYSQNMIHDGMDFHRFLSNALNQFNLTGGTSFNAGK